MRSPERRYQLLKIGASQIGPGRQRGQFTFEFRKAVRVISMHNHTEVPPKFQRLVLLEFQLCPSVGGALRIQMDLVRINQLAIGKQV